MSAKRILLLTNRVPYPLTDGGSIAMHAMLEGYVDAGWEVMLFSMNTTRHFVSLETLPPIYHQISFETFEIDTEIRFFPVVRNFLLSRRPNHAERFYHKDFQKRLVQLIRGFEPDLIQIESIFMATYIPAIRNATTAKVLIRLHNIEHHIWEQLAVETSNTLRRYYLRDLAVRIRKFEISMWKKADGLLAISGPDADTVREHIPDKPVLLVPAGISIKDGAPAAGITEEWCGYHIGAMDWVPNAESIAWFIEEVWPVIHQQAPEFHFHFAGRAMPASFKKYEKNGVFCAGEVNDAAAFIADKKILIVPLRSGGGVRVKIMEALAHGKLVLSTRTGIAGIREAVPGTHFLQADTPEEFAAQIAWILKNKEAATAIAAAGNRLVREVYDNRAVMQRLLQQLDS